MPLPSWPLVALCILIAAWLLTRHAIALIVAAPARPVRALNQRRNHGRHSTRRREVTT